MKPPLRALALIIVLSAVVAGLSACSGRVETGLAPTSAPTALPVNVPPTRSMTPAVTPTFQSAAATPTPTPEPTPCVYPVQPALSDAWKPEEIGCPYGPGLDGISTAYAPFEGGQMLWRGDADAIYVLYHDGTWERYENEWREGDPTYTCGEPNSPPTPVRGFGRVWCDHPAVREALGAVAAYEIGDNAGAAQDFVNGTLLTAPFGRVFVFVGESGAWRYGDE